MKKKILVVDDEPDLLKIACFRLESLGYEIISAVNGQEALDLATKENPDLVLLDVRLPVLSGIDACMQMKNDDKLKQIPVILFTASTQDLKGKASSAGAQDFIVKPFNVDELLEKIKKLIG